MKTRFLFIFGRSAVPELLSASLCLSFSYLPDGIGFIINAKCTESDEDPPGKRESAAGKRFCPMKCDESGN